jgi:hypothetical protein
VPLTGPPASRRVDSSRQIVVESAHYVQIVELGGVEVEGPGASGSEASMPGSP